MPLMPNDFVGLNTSLYSTLHGKQIEHLERSIWLRRVGRFNEALDIFRENLDEVKEVPVVLIEQANIYLECYSYGKLYRFLDKPLRDREGDEETLARPEWRLMALTRAMVVVRHRGTIEPAIEELERTQKWLKDFPVDSYTDVHVNCVWRYIIAYLFVKLGATYECPDAELIPRPESVFAPWQGLTDLRSSLLKRGMVRHAAGLFRVEISRTPLMDRLRKYEEIIPTLSMIESPRSRHLAEADLRLRLCDDLAIIHDLSAAQNEAVKCELALDSLCSDPNVDLGDDQSHRLHLQLVRLGFISDPIAKFNAAIELLEPLSARSHPNQGNCLYLATEVAAMIAQTGSEAHLVKFYELHRRLEHLNEYVFEDLCDLVSCQSGLLSLTVDNRVDAQKSLEWIQGFFLKYPHFQAPTVMANLYYKCSILFNTVRDEGRSKEALDRSREWDRRAGQVQNIHHQNYTNIFANSGGSAEDSAYDSEDDVSNFSFSERWIHCLTDIPQGTMIVMHAIIDWAFDDLGKDLITINTVTGLFGMDAEDLEQMREHGANKYREKLKSVDAGAVFEAVYLPGGRPSHERYDALSSWLHKPPKGSRNDRLFGLLMFLYIRKGWLEQLQLRDVHIEEIDRTLELQSNFPQMLKAFSSPWRWAWVVEKAWCYYLKFLATGDLETGWDFVLKAKCLVEEAVSGFRETKQIGQVALGQRLSAQISLLYIRKLQQRDSVQDAGGAHGSANLSINEQIRQLRRDGLEAVLETDRIFTEIELEASWLDGVEGIEERKKVARFQNSHTTVQVAVQLLLSAPDERSDESRMLVWELVQKFKARSLARTIGMFRPNPPGLVNKILASPDCGPVYQEMLDLQARIDAAEAKDRLHLRRTLDAHRKKMKEHDLLRQLINRREGTPFDLSELDGIQSQAGKPVVLVDWFFVPPYFNDPPKMGDGFIILLTARARQTPTIDILDTDPSAAAKWIKATFTAQKDLDQPMLGRHSAKTDLNQLCGSLVTPLERRTREGDVLVLCPTHELHRLPMHALDVDEEPLIRRNPVLYIHSHSLLRSCQSAALYAADVQSPMNALVFSGIGRIHDRSYRAGRKSVVDVAARLNAEPLIDETATKPRFLDSVTRSRVFHLHTHCSWNASDALEHSLEFPVLTDPPPQSPIPIHDTTERPKLTAREIFDVRLQQGGHVNLIACSAGSIDNQAGDEPMGLVPAILYSGASSTVSTLWPIEDDVGDRFSRSFFDSFIRQAKKNDQGALRSIRELAQALPEIDREYRRGEIERSVRWIDIAEAVQLAVLSLDPQQTEPLLSWAGFILHGFWMFPVTGDESKELK
ncbi:hypothetical protein NA57DRAFT_71274 [Rhizodiscina lignyota]|uniref:CHAT domain-containing protein n=1 Tax=Rhizodiscina lignyota TaxID=1504668 RepID=A0A9P4ISJ8_9PEZI|nr:hypothetical protein NA57DRAFT_71274 [Rhizodiscina lignyota]